MYLGEVTEPRGPESEFRPLTPHERAVLSALLVEPFAGRDQLVRQLDHVQARRIDDEGSLAMTAIGAVPAPVLYPVPVDGSMLDVDGVPVHVLLHVIDGYMNELEIYKADRSKPLRMIDPESLTVISLSSSGDIGARCLRRPSCSGIFGTVPRSWHQEPGSAPLR